MDWNMKTINNCNIPLIWWHSEALPPFLAIKQLTVAEMVCQRRLLQQTIGAGILNWPLILLNQHIIFSLFVVEIKWKTKAVLIIFPSPTESRTWGKFLEWPPCTSWFQKGSFWLRQIGNYEVPMYCRASRRNKKHLCTLNLNEASEIYLYSYVHLTLLTTTINTELI